jgi:hypothetical protein
VLSLPQVKDSLPKGLEIILNLILARYVSEESYKVFKPRMIKSDDLRFIKGEVEIIYSTRGDFQPMMKHHQDSEILKIKEGEN